MPISLPVLVDTASGRLRSRNGNCDDVVIMILGKILQIAVYCCLQVHEVRDRSKHVQCLRTEVGHRSTSVEDTRTLTQVVFIKISGDRTGFRWMPLNL